MTEVSIDEERLWESLQKLGTIGEQPDGSMMRVTGSEADKRARDQVVEWFDDAGLQVTIDAIGNIYARRPGTDGGAPVLTGSHLDTVPNGGKFDGSAGVLTALEAIRAWNEAGIETDRPVEIVIFTEEEGTRFGTGLLGSGVASGSISVERALAFEDDDGNTVETVLEGIGYQGASTRHLGDITAFVELHVEQGPKLEATGNHIGVVEAITGLAQFEVTMLGESNHAGTTSMDLRQDAFSGVAELAQSLERKASDLAEESDAVGTIGKVDIQPGGANVIPGEVEFTLDIRDVHERSRQDLIEFVFKEAATIADRRELTVSHRKLLDVATINMDDQVVATLEAVCEDVSIDYMRMSSGAGHDAMNVANVGPTAMLFVPSQDGISHNPDEYTSPDDLATGTRVLERGLRSLADC